MRRYKDWDPETSSPKYLSKALFHQFLSHTECLTLHPEFLSGGVEGQQIQQRRQMANTHGFIVPLLASVLGTGQFVVDFCILVPCALLSPPLFYVSFILIIHLYTHPANVFFFFFGLITVHWAWIKYQRLKYKDVKDTILDLGELIHPVEETDTQVKLSPC